MSCLTQMKNYLHIKEILLDMSNQYIYRTNILISIGHIGIPSHDITRKKLLVALFARLDRAFANIHLLNLYPTDVVSNLQF